MAAHQQRLRRLVLDAERSGAFEEPVHRRAVERPRASMAIGTGEANEQLEVDAGGQAPEGAVAHAVARLVERARPQVLGDDAEDLAPHVDAVHRLHVEAVEEARGRRDAGSLVAGRAPSAVDHCGGRRLAEVMTYRAEHHRRQPRPIEVAVPASRLVDDHQRVRPHVALGMPLGILRAVVQRHHLGQDPFDDAEIAGEREPDRRPLGGEQQLLDLAPQPLGREVVERDGPADGPGLVVECALEAGGELQRPQDSQAVVGEGPRIDDAQPARGQIVAAAARVEVLAAEWVPGDRVDREVAPARGVFEASSPDRLRRERRCDPGRSSTHDAAGRHRSDPA